MQHFDYIFNVGGNQFPTTVLPKNNELHLMSNTSSRVRILYYKTNFNIDPAECDYETWASLYGQALWLEK